MIELVKELVAGIATSDGGGSAPVIDELNVTPTTSAQTITAPEGTDGYSPVNVSAVTSSIDANITAGNIKNGVSILGVSGTLEASDTITATNKSSSAVSANDKVWVNSVGASPKQVGNVAYAFYGLIGNDRVGYNEKVYSIDDLSAGTFTQLYSITYFSWLGGGDFIYYQPKNKNPYLRENVDTAWSSLGASAETYSLTDALSIGYPSALCIDQDGYTWLVNSDNYNLTKFDTDTLATVSTYSGANKLTGGTSTFIKVGDYFICGKYDSTHPEWTYVLKLSGSSLSEQNDWTVTGDATFEYARHAIALDANTYIIFYGSTSAGYNYSYTSGMNFLNGIAVATVDTTNKTVNFKTSSLPAGLASWAKANASTGDVMATFNQNCGVLCLAQAGSTTPSYALYKYNSGTWQNLNLDLTGVLPSGNYFTSAITISDNGNLISFGYGSSSSYPAYDSNRSQVIYDLAAEKTFQIVDFSSVTSSSISGIAKGNIAVNASGNVKTVLE